MNLHPSGLIVFLALFGMVARAERESVREKIERVKAALAAGNSDYRADQLFPIRYSKEAEAPDFVPVEQVVFKVGRSTVKADAGETVVTLTVDLEPDGKIRGYARGQTTIYRQDSAAGKNGGVGDGSGISPGLLDSVRDANRGLLRRPPVTAQDKERAERIAKFGEKARKSELDELRRLLVTAGDDSAKLKEILTGIANSGNPATRELVLPQLKSRHAEVREMAAAALGKVGRLDDLQLLEGMLKDENPSVRAMARLSQSVLKESRRPRTL